MSVEHVWGIERTVLLEKQCSEQSLSCAFVVKDTGEVAKE